MRNLVDLIASDSWAITKNALENIIAIAERTPIDSGVVYNSMHGAAVKETKETNLEVEQFLSSGVAVIPIVGPIFPRANIMTTMSGATSIEQITRDIQSAINNPKVKSIVLNIDSPGGAVTGVNELANTIKSLQAIKPINAYVYGMCASAAFWIASSANKIYASETSEIGSVGVVCAYKDQSEKDTRDGVKTIEIVSSVSPYKRVSPSTPEGKEKVQRMVDSIASVFVQSLSANRGMDEKVILADYGKGETYLSVKAYANGMIDGIGSLSSVVAMYSKENKFKKGERMESEQTESTEAVQTFTAEGLRESDPVLFDAIKEIGAKEERERIQSIESLSSIPGAESVISENKFKPGMTKDALAFLILEAQETQRKNALNAIQQDATALATDSQGALPDPTASDEEAKEKKQKQIVANIVSGINSKK